MKSETHIPIHSSADVVMARQNGRAWALKEGFNGADLTVIVTVISEVARNIVDHARGGEIVLASAHRGNREGISIVAHDDGPSIPKENHAMHYDYSRRQSFGVHLPGAKSLMDEFDVRSRAGKGTTVVMKKWLR
jgi:serine/threonine-protein kinase RsbT